MRIPLLFALIILVQPKVSHAQQIVNIDFNNGLDSIYVSIDTTNSNNVWQIGKPVKSLFDTTLIPPNALITDTANPYPINDTSIFYVKQYSNDIWTGLGVNVWVDSDSLNDYGYIDVSFDGGNNWFDLTDTLYDLGHIPSPVFTGTLDYLDYQAFWWIGVIYSSQSPIDSALYKFVWISDSIFEGRDGWLIHQIQTWNEQWEGIEETEFAKLATKAFPSPTNKEITIEFDNPKGTAFYLSVLDGTGKIVHHLPQVTEGKIQIDVGNLPTGIYHYQVTNPVDWQSGWGRFVAVRSMT